MKLAIGSIIRRPEKLDKLGAAAREKVRDKLTWEAKANQIAAIYNAVLSGTRTFTFSQISTDVDEIRATNVEPTLSMRGVPAAYSG